MFELIEAYGLLGIQHIASLILGFVRTKILAITLGPFGVGILSQANAFLSFMQGMSGLGLAGGYTKMVAEYRSQQEESKLNKTIISLITLYGIVGVILLGISVVVAKPVAAWAFNDSSLGRYIIIIVAAAAIWIQYQAVLFTFRGLLHWKEHSLVSTLGYIVNIIITIPMIYLGGLDGAVWSIFVAQVMNLVIAVLILQARIAPLYQLQYWRYRPDLATLRELLPYFAPNLSVQLIATFAIASIRGGLIRNLGAEANGIYQAVWAISMAYMGFLLSATTTYGIPKVSSLLKDPEEGVKVQNYGIRVGIFLLCPIMILLLNFREIWIPILYSRDFLIAGPMLFLQFSADLVRMVRNNLNVILQPLKRLKFLFVDGVLYWVGWLLLSLVAVPRLGIVGVPVSYFTVNIVSFTWLFAYHKLTTTFRVLGYNKILIMKIAPLLVAGYAVAWFVDSLWWRGLVCAILLSIMATWLPTQDERGKVLGIVRNTWYNKITNRL